jgi:DNA-binding MarR family transcriptional regulator
VSRARFDPLIHAETRLRICALLSAFDEAEFTLVTDQLNISDSVLSKQAAALSAAGYLQITKRPANGRQRTWLALTRAGERAFAGHMGALRQIAEQPVPRPPRVRG